MNELLRIFASTIAAVVAYWVVDDIESMHRLMIGILFFYTVAFNGRK